tara:strand:- start:71197 stop:73875 length:2679 start_codon:yes stop_codon:yes gene_type:complete
MKLKQQSLINLENFNQRKNIKTTPMMEQYLNVKSKHRDYLLFYRMGDFYELFFEDAIVASKNLGITLTKRGKLDNESIPMCGVPYHSVQNYLSRLITLGFKIAIAEQLEHNVPEDLNKKKSPKIFRRDVVRIITPGTILEESLLDSKNYNFLTSLYISKGKGAIAWIDMTAGDFKVMSLDKNLMEKDLAEQLYKINPREIITTEDISKDILLKKDLKPWSDRITLLPFSFYDEQNCIERILSFYKLKNLDSFGNIEKTEVSTVAALIEYLKLTQKDNVPFIPKLEVIKNKNFMEIDKISAVSLELFARNKDDKQGTLLHTIDFTKTSIGARMLKEFLNNPLTEIYLINERLDYVEQFLKAETLVSDIRDILKKIPDPERALSRISANLKNPRDAFIIFEFISESLKIFKRIKEENNKILNKLLISENLEQNFSKLKQNIKILLKENPPINLNEGGVINDGVSKKLDYLRNIRLEFQKKIVSFQIKYSDQIGLKNLKIKYNNFHGYFIETSNKNSYKLNQSEEIDFLLIQNTVNNSRYQTQELKNLSFEIEKAESDSVKLEKELYFNLCKEILKNFSKLNSMSKLIAFVDVLNNFAHISKERNYVRPKFSLKKKLDIIDGRHPVVEESLRGSGNQFIPNNCSLEAKNQTWLMTGPNMAGKSTFLRQVAIICILAQMGCYVPAKSADLSILDKVFTRIGASDDLSRGLSTFMVEMIETARILNGATDKSLVILDELGRGTSTSDGLALSWAILEFIVLEKKCITFFATHYKELTKIKQSFKEISLKTLQTQKWGEDIIFLYKVIDGISESSFGLHVAKIAGIKSSIVKRAAEIITKLKVLNLDDDFKKQQGLTNKNYEKNEDFSEIIEIIKNLEPDSLSPKQALEIIYNLKNKT